VHGRMVITKLLEEIIREVEIPLRVKEIEGDAVFLFAIKPDARRSFARSDASRKCPAPT
jgi:Protein of unknown function (DUF2652)